MGFRSRTMSKGGMRSRVSICVRTLVCTTPALTRMRCIRTSATISAPVHCFPSILVPMIGNGVMNGLDRGTNGSRDIGFPDGLPKRKNTLYVLENRSHREDARCKADSVFKLATMFKLATKLRLIHINFTYYMCLFSV